MIARGGSGGNAPIQMGLQRAQPFCNNTPEHKHKRIYGVLAFVKIEGNESEVIEHALKQGLIIVKAMNGTNKVLNAKDFQPRDFCPTTVRT